MLNLVVCDYNSGYMGSWGREDGVQGRGEERERGRGRKGDTGTVLVTLTYLPKYTIMNTFKLYGSPGYQWHHHQLFSHETIKMTCLSLNTPVLLLFYLFVSVCVCMCVCIFILPEPSCCPLDIWFLFKLLLNFSSQGISTIYTMDLNILLPFCLHYLCEELFSTLIIIKSKYSSVFKNTEDVLNPPANKAQPPNQYANLLYL